MRDQLLREARAISSAGRFLTRLPFPFAPVEASWRDDLKRAPRYFPLIGGLIGALTGLLYWLLCHVLPPPAAAACALAFDALVTGAFHEDALADFFDAFSGGRSPKRVREILKDSRLGSYGATALVLGLIVRWSALFSLAPVFAIAASAASAALGRLGALLALRLLPPAEDRVTLTRDVGAQPSGGSVTIGAFCAALFLAPALVLSPPGGALAALAAAVPLVWMLLVMKRTLGGVVGDGLGAIAFAAQAAALMAFAAAT